MGVNSIPELVVNSNSRIGIDYLKQNWIGIDKYLIEMKFPKNIFIHKWIHHLIQKYFFHDNPTWNINYSEHLLIVKTSR